MKPDAKRVSRLRTAVRQTVAASPALRRDRRKPPGFLRRHWRWAALRWLVTGIFLFSAALGAPVPLLLGYAVLWTLAVTCSRAAQLVNSLQSPGLLWPYYELPVSNDAVFQMQRRRWLRDSLWGGADWAAIGLGIALHDPSAIRWLLILPLAVAQGAGIIALAAWMVRRWPRFPYGFPLFLCGALLFVCIKFFESGVRFTFIEPLFRFLMIVSPAGWLAQAYVAAESLHPSGWLSLLSLGTVAGLLIRPALQGLRRDFSLETLFGYTTGTEAPPAHATLSTATLREDLDSDEPSFNPERATALPPPDLTTLRQRLAGHLAADPARVLAKGFMELHIHRCLTRRDRILVESLRLAPAWTWSRGWVIALGLLLFARLLALAGLAPVWPGLFATAALVLFVFPALGGNWSGFDAAPTFQYHVGMQSYLPVGFWESARVMLKVNLLRTVAGLPLLVLAVRYGYTAEPIGWIQTLDWTWRVMLLFVATLPFWVIVQFSKNSNDTAARWWFTALLAGAFLLGLVAMVGGGVMMFGISERLPGLIMGGILVLYFAGLLAGYGLAYRRGVFDLMNFPRAS